MTAQVSSRFSISSKTRGSADLVPYFAWPVTEAIRPNDKVDQHITVFDLEVGKHQRVDSHLEAVKQALLKKETDLSRLVNECHFGLWVSYRFPDENGAFSLSPAMLAAFASLRVEIIFHLNEH